MKKLLLLLVLTPFLSLAQQTKPCSAEEFSQFNFWLGQWQVSDRNNGQEAGVNNITSIENGCALLEQWKGKTGTTGQSINFYNPVNKQWRQLWVATGYSIDIAGGWNSTSMVLEGEIFYHNQSAPIPFKGTWTPNKDGSVRQFFQQFDTESESWKPWFDGLYKKAASKE